MNIGSVKPKQLMEPVLESRPNKVLSQGEMRLIQETTTHLQAKLGEQYNTFTMRPINYNLTSDIDAAAYLEELKQNPSINSKIMNPAGQSEALLNPVSDFMKGKGFDNIRYRGIFIWNSATEQMPMNHFVVVGNKGEVDYVFDISAHQFENKGVSSLNGSLILSADEWAGKLNIVAQPKGN